MGTGKSYWGARLSEISGVKFIDLDQRIEELAAQKISTLFEENGEEGFRLLEQKTLQEISLSTDNFIMACGGGTPCFFNNLEFMKKHGTVVWLTSSLEKIQDRLQAERAHRPLVSKLTDEQLKEFISSTLKKRQFYYEKAHYTVDTEHSNAANLLKSIIHV
jgi:shikimate kinase